jgi:hypothetical protein
MLGVRIFNFVNTTNNAKVTVCEVLKMFKRPCTEVCVNKLMETGGWELAGEGVLLCMCESVAIFLRLNAFY